MPRLALSLARAAATVAFVLSAGSAYALNDHSWVSSTGGGERVHRVAPCADFDSAQTATKPGGVISVLDSGDYSDIIITKSLTIRAEGVDGGIGSFSRRIGFLSLPAPATWSRWKGYTSTVPALVFLPEGNCISSDVSSTITLVAMSGSILRPTAAPTLSVTDTVITNFGSGTGGGIVINPQAGGSAQVALERVTVNGNAFGIAADGSNGSAGINMTIADSMVANNAQDGIIATTPAGGAPIGVLVANTKSVNNAIGIRSLGPNVTVRVKNPNFTAAAPPGLRFRRGALFFFRHHAGPAQGRGRPFSRGRAGKKRE